MFTTWTILLVFSSILTIISLRNINILLSLGATIGWFSLMAYNLDNPLVGVVQGSIIHQWLTMGFIAIGLAVMLVFFKNRGKIVNRSESWGETRSKGGGEEGGVVTPERRGLMEMSPTEYRAIARRAVKRKR